MKTQKLQNADDAGRAASSLKSGRAVTVRRLVGEAEDVPAGRFVGYGHQGKVLTSGSPAEIAVCPAKRLPTRTAALATDRPKRKGLLLLVSW
jgi:hypothetical protein